MDLPGAFTATNRTIQKVANIAIALHALRQISDLISRSAKSDPVIHATSTQSTSVQPSLNDRKSTVSKTAFNATSVEEFSTARNLDHIQSPCKMLIESDLILQMKSPLDEADKKQTSSGIPHPKRWIQCGCSTPSKQKLNNSALDNGAFNASNPFAPQYKYV